MNALQDSLDAMRQHLTKSVSELTFNRAHFSKTIPGLQFAWDSTSLGALKECPKRYYYSQILSLRSRREATPLTFGLHYHAALEHYDRAICDGATEVEAVRHAVFTALSRAGNRVKTKNCLTCGEAGQSATHVYCKSCLGTDFEETDSWEPWESDDTKRNRETLIRSVVWYLDHFKHDPTKTIVLSSGKPAVELSFRMPTDIELPDSNIVLLCGHIDRLVEFQGGIWFTDRKTTISALSEDYFSHYSPDNQMSVYTIASRVVFDRPARGGIIDAAQVAVGFTRFQRGFVSRTKAQNDEWMRDLEWWMQMACAYAEHEHWPMNDKACRLCNYKSICSKDPAVRSQFLAAGFKIHEWNPLDERNGE